jgi:hypothetical protein
MNNEVEEWRDIEGYEGIYQVSNLGRVKSLDRAVQHRNGKVLMKKGKQLKVVYAGNKYGRIILNKNGKKSAKLIHRLVALTFIINETNLKEVNHKDLDKTNNSVENLEWVSPKQNTQHAFNNRYIKRYLGEDNHRAVVTEEVVLKIRELHATKKYRYKDIGEMFGIHHSVVGYIVRRQTWRHI